VIPGQAAATGSLADSYILEASAGTGKTRALVRRFVEAVAAGVEVHRIVAVTFTHAAAGEMKLRLRHELDRERQVSLDDPVRAERLARGLQHLEEAFVGTIHSFCAHLLAQRPVEARVDPHFEPLAQAEANAVFDRVFRRWFEKRLSQPSPAIARCLARLSVPTGHGGRRPVDALRSAALDLAEWRDHPTPWTVREFDRAAEIDDLLKQCAELAKLRNACARGQWDPLYRSLQPLADFEERVRRATELGCTDLDSIESELLRLPIDMRWLKKGSGNYGPGVTREAIVTAWDNLAASIEAFRRKADADLAAHLRNELWEVVELYQAEKERAGQVDFLDLLIKARDLLKDPEARQALQERYECIFVDEFQDTDPLQAEILVLLSAGDPEEADWRKVTPAAGKLFLVGDPKQSIYRFRRADVALYRSVCKDLESRGVKRAALQSSLRSVKPIQDFVNAAFHDRMEAYLPLCGGREAKPTQPSIIALPVPFPFGGNDEIAYSAIEKCAPDTAAAFIEWLLQESGWTVSDQSDANLQRPIQAGDICVLFRRFMSHGVDVTQEYVRCLEARGIRHVLIGSKSFHHREEVATIRTALRAIEWPDDELSVFAVIRGSLFGVDDGTLLKFRTQVGRLHPFHNLGDDLAPEFEPIRDALALLADLHCRRNYRPIADTIRRLMEHTRAHAGFAFRPGGERVLANVYRVADLARSFEAGRPTSFRAFVEYLESEAEGGEMSEAPILEHQSDGVKLMTVHKAKGLEFPVVILTDPTAKLIRAAGGSRYVDPDQRLCAQRLLGWAPWELLDHAAEEAQQEREEADRLAYVAATRARDLLVVMAVGEKELEGRWLSPLWPALYPRREHWRNPSRPPGCPVKGDTTVLERPLSHHGVDSSIRPGLHRSQRDVEVVWFDPAVLRLRVKMQSGVAYENILKGSAEQKVEGVRRYKEWQRRKAEAIEAGSQREFEVIAATEFQDELGSDIPFELVPLDEDRGGRPAGRSFGTLVHALLAEAEDIADLTRLAAIHGQILAEEREAAVAAAKRALQHQLLREAAKAQRRHRELPFVLPLPGGRVLEGVIDLAYFDGSVWTVVDIKTGSADRLRYRRQLQLYGYALRQITGQPVRAVLLEV
jgi:ATP-dependent exoDNAse (exonuclease V) beta subunit (contains helicase and exonuclease domains)